MLKKRSNKMQIDGIHLTWIVVSNMEEAIHFYTHVVGMTLVTKNTQYAWAELQGPNGAKLGLSLENPEYNLKAGTNAVVTIVVDNLQDARKELLEKNVQLLGEVCEIPGQVKLQSFHDKDGNHFQLVEVLRS
ncbi:hypothetical protein PHSC3_002018 [Chlamydiales bacterium STE3]|nr:hypothetical protein PHSC3_002018 [Chlamydiales bacterium STE3]